MNDRISQSNGSSAIKKRSSQIGTNALVRGATQVRRLLKKILLVLQQEKASLTHYSGTATSAHTFHLDNGGVSV